MPVAAQGDFLAFYDATVADAHRYASRLTGGDRPRAEDLVQEVYLQLLQGARAGRVTEASFGWLAVALRHRFLDGCRSADRESRRIRLVWSRDEVDDPKPSDEDLWAGTALSDRERVALTLRYVDDLPVAQVAAELGATLGATESLLARGRARLRLEARHD